MGLLRFYQKTRWLRSSLGLLALLGTGSQIPGWMYPQSAGPLSAYFFPILAATILALLIYGVGLLICLPLALYQRRFWMSLRITLQFGLVAALFSCWWFMLAVMGGAVGGH